MAQIVIRNLDDAVIEALRRRAAACGTSTEETADEAFAAAAARHAVYAPAGRLLGG